LTRRRGWPIVLREVITTPAGQLVRDARLGLGLTYEGAADKCGLKPWNIQDIERGKSKDAGATILLGISRGLGIPLDVLMEAFAANGDIVPTPEMTK